MTNPKRETSARSQANSTSGTIWTGDNIHIMRDMNSESVDLIPLSTQTATMKPR